MPDVYVTCEVCNGKRYNQETLAVKFNGYSIADVLDLAIEDALPVLADIPNVRQKLQTLVDVGLGYIHLGQSATTLSGGEAQRMKLARELSKRQTGRTLYLLDEPTTGLHFDDVRRCSRSCIALPISATPSSSSNTTSTSSATPTGSSTSAPRAAKTAAASSPRAPPNTSPPSPTRTPANFCAAITVNRSQVWLPVATTLPKFELSSTEPSTRPSPPEALRQSDHPVTRNRTLHRRAAQNSPASSPDRRSPAASSEVPAFAPEPIPPGDLWRPDDTPNHAPSSSCLKYRRRQHLPLLRARHRRHPAHHSRRLAATSSCSRPFVIRTCRFPRSRNRPQPHPISIAGDRISGPAGANCASIPTLWHRPFWQGSIGTAPRRRDGFCFSPASVSSLGLLNGARQQPAAHAQRSAHPQRPDAQSLTGAWLMFSSALPSRHLLKSSLFAASSCRHLINFFRWLPTQETSAARANHRPRPSFPLSILLASLPFALHALRPSLRRLGPRPAHRHRQHRALHRPAQDPLARRQRSSSTRSTTSPSSPACSTKPTGSVTSTNSKPNDAQPPSSREPDLPHAQTPACCS